MLAHRLDPAGGVFALRPAEVGADADALDSSLEQQLERRQCGADAGVVGDLPVLERDVEVGADEDGLAVDVGVANRARQAHPRAAASGRARSGCPTDRADTRRGRPSAADRRARGRRAPAGRRRASTSSTSSTSSVESPCGRSSTTSPWSARTKIATVPPGVEGCIAARLVAGGDGETERLAVEAERGREVVDEQPGLREPHQSSLPIRSTSRHE